MSAAFTGYATHKGMLRDGTLRIMIEVPQEHAGIASQMLVSPDTPVAVALLDSKADLSQNVVEQQHVECKNLGAVLHRTGYFYHRPFLGALASDDEFLSCCLGQDWWPW